MATHDRSKKLVSFLATEWGASQLTRVGESKKMDLWSHRVKEGNCVLIMMKSGNVFFNLSAMLT